MATYRTQRQVNDIGLMSYPREEYSDRELSTSLELLKKYAKENRTVSYQEFWNDLLCKGCEYFVGPDDSRLHDLIGLIGRQEVERGRANIGVLVRYKNKTKRPGPGFFELCRVLDKSLSSKSEKQIYDQVINAVFAQYRIQDQ
jgi:hypothetical protein